MFLLTCSNILGSVGRKDFIFLNIFRWFLKGTHSDFKSACSKMANKTLGEAQNIRVDRVSGNTCKCFFV
jgi:hypothetical protein